jgi:hypothetical protein
MINPAIPCQSRKQLYSNPEKIVECDDGTELTLEEYEDRENMIAEQAG